MTLPEAKSFAVRGEPRFAEARAAVAPRAGAAMARPAWGGGI